MTTKAETFIKLACEIMPHQTELQELDPKIDNESHIDKIMFRKSEYIGGMAVVLLTLMHRPK